jgi:hypothetical protein
MTEKQGYQVYRLNLLVDPRLSKELAELVVLVLASALIFILQLKRKL